MLFVVWDTGTVPFASEVLKRAILWPPKAFWPTVEVGLQVGGLHPDGRTGPLYSKPCKEATLQPTKALWLIKFLFINSCSPSCKILPASFACMLIRKGNVMTTRNMFRYPILLCKLRQKLKLYLMKIDEQEDKLSSIYMHQLV